MEDDINYILQAIGNETRRKILLYVAKEGPISYTKLMKRVGVEDSGTFGFHLRKMQRLLKKDDMGEYVLSDLGRKAIEILNRIGYTQMEGKHIEQPLEKDYKVKVIGDMLSYELTEDIARMYREKGYKLVFKDILKLTIHDMPRDLFDEVVEEIDNCLTVSAPSSLRDLVELKAKEVFNLRSIGRGGPGPKISMDLGLIEGIVSGVLTSVMDIISKAALKMPARGNLELIVDEEYKLDDVEELYLECSGGLANFKFGGRDRLVIWARPGTEPRVDLDKIGGRLRIDVYGDKLELNSSKDVFRSCRVDVSGGMVSLERGVYKELSIDVSGGAVKVKDVVLRRGLNLGLEGGVVNVEVSMEDGGEKVIRGELSGGMMKVEARVPRGTKVKVGGRTLGGVASIRRGSSRLSPGYMDPGYADAESKLLIELDISGGYVDIHIVE